MRYVARLAALLLLTVPAAAEPFHHSYGEWREYFRDWLASCPDTINEDSTDYYGYSCFASTGSQALNSANLPAYKLTLIRNRLDGELDLAITVAADQGAYDESRPMRLLFAGDGPVMLNMGEHIETRFNVTNQYFVADAELEARLIERMKERASLKLVVPMTGEEQPADIWLSLQGVMGSLDFMASNARKVEQY
ncbi:hypothetical protein ASD83_08290 [Devosia sp. Root685]|uniref:hypothetical protein n=1 Tax=Devosia sp. Root685 TaxID=1736587 RepID=UPI0006F9AF62|nr:hypothetical protein [Devosia sp. Root685]KRB01484.1 hypothetical protein ASD83_08290 [Devosia sp. Root685]